MSTIELAGVTKAWGGTVAVDDVSFTVEEGSFVVLLGPSGCGKSTTLRMIAGLETVSAGRVLIAGRDVTDSPPSERNISMVFQSYALFPHLDVAENIVFGLRVRKTPAAERAKRLARVAETVGLSELLGRKAAQLSGGQRQRVALARAIIAENPICLMDEPLSNLDAKLRHDMRGEIRGLQQRLGMTVVYVTHDQSEAMSMADKVILLRDGRVVQAGAPDQLYERPANVFTAGFIGTPPMNLLGGRSWYRFARFADYAATLDAEPAAVNVAMLVGHSTLRAATMDDLARPASAGEIDRMGGLLDESLAAGAIGLSTGLAYATASAAPPAEVTALAARLAPVGGVYTTHMRNEGERVVEAVEEALATAREAGVRVVLSHHKASGRRNWGRTRETLALIERAREAQSVDLDVYPYTASSTVLLVDWIEDAERVLVTWSEPHPGVAGRELAAIAAEWGIGLRDAAERLLPAGAIYFSMHEDDLRRVLAFPRAMIGSDGLPHDAHPHPRLRQRVCRRPRCRPDCRTASNW